MIVPGGRLWSYRCSDGLQRLTAQPVNCMERYSCDNVEFLDSYVVAFVQFTAQRDQTVTSCRPAKTTGRGRGDNGFNNSDGARAGQNWVGQTDCP